MSKPTKAQLAGAVAELHTCIQIIDGLYRNDRPGSNMDRSDRIADQVRRADHIAKILWAFDPNYPDIRPFKDARP